MRTLNSAKNMFASLSITMVMIFLGFITRKIFVDSIGVEYLGLNGVLQNILGVMALLEGGFATSVVYNMYKPLAERDESKILALLQLYKRVYRYIALGLFIFAMAILPFVDIFLKDAESLPYVSIVYCIFLINSLLQYFTAYKWSLINADQKQYKLMGINLIYQVGLNLSKLAILYYTQNYILYLVAETLFAVGLNISIVYKVNQLYPFIVTKIKYRVDPLVKKNIIINMKALFLHSIGGYFMHSTDNIIISSFVGISTVGLYSNYTLIINTIRSMINQILNSFSESVGNLIAAESSEKVYEVFKIVFFINFLVVSIPIVILFNCITPFIMWWLGDEYLLGLSTLIVILLNFYIDNMRTSSLMFKVKSGIFVQDRFTPLIQGVINLGLSLLFVNWWGITGVLLASVISIMSIGFWQFPRLVYKYSFHKSLFLYFKQYIVYTSLILITLLSSHLLCNIVYVENVFLSVITNGILSLVCVAILYSIFLIKSSTCLQFINYTKMLLKR